MRINKQIGIRHLLVVMSLVAVMVAATRFGQAGISLIPPIGFSGPMVVTWMLRWQQAIQVIFLPITLVGLLATLFSLPQMLYEIGWWQVPRNIFATLILLPSLIIVAEAHKRTYGRLHDIGESVRTMCQLTQTLFPWFIISMLHVARLFGHPIPMV